MGDVNIHSFDCDNCFTGILEHTEELGLGKVSWNEVSENILKLIIMIVAPSCEYIRNIQILQILFQLIWYKVTK